MCEFTSLFHAVTHSEHLQMLRTHVSRNLCLKILEHARFIPQPTNNLVKDPTVYLKLWVLGMM